MNPIDTMHVLTQMIYARLRWLTRTGEANQPRDRGAVSLEQVLWFVAAGAAVAGIAAIIWAKVRSAANSVGP